MREIVLDTETTGLKPQEGHRIIEIGCLELVNHMPTGQTYHAFINPQRDVPPEASAVSGITTAFLKPYPIFVKIVDAFLDFIADSPLIIHNATFDMAFLNAELDRLCRPLLPHSRAIDTLKMARQKFPGSPASLDALCRRFQIDTSARVKHGALIDAELLAQVYLELIGGRQTSFVFQEEPISTVISSHATALVPPNLPVRPPRIFPLTDAEKKDHAALIKNIKNPLWGYK